MGRMGRWIGERMRQGWRRDGPYGAILPPVVVFLALQVLRGDDGELSAVAVAIALALGLAVWAVVRWRRDDPAPDPEDGRSP